MLTKEIILGSGIRPTEPKNQVNCKIMNHILLAAWELNFSESMQAFRLKASRVGMSYFIGRETAR